MNRMELNEWYVRMINEINDPPAYYNHHVFFCTNERPEGHLRGCCKAKGAEEIRNHMKMRAKELGLKGVRINTAGCLDRCEMGPTVVIYPEGVWYKCASIEDADRILLQHIQFGQRAEGLILGPND